MPVKLFEEKVKTHLRRELINITDLVIEKVRESGIKNGIVLVFVPHATAALITNEDENNLRKDIYNLLEKLVPQDAAYHHNLIDNNADSHLLSILLKPFLIFPLVNGNLVRGTWQEILLVELDGPRWRRVIIEVIGE